MSRRVVVAGAVIGPWMGVRIAPGFARSLAEAEALTDAVMVPRRERREAARAAEVAAGIAIVAEAGHKAAIAIDGRTCATEGES